MPLRFVRGVLAVAVALAVVGGLYLLSHRSSSVVSQETDTTVRSASATTSAVSAAGAAKPSTVVREEGVLPSVPVKVKMPAPAVFGLHGPVTIDDVPTGRFRGELVALSEDARQRALAKLAKLKVPLNDVASLSVEANGMLFYQCASPLPPKPVPETAGAAELAAQPANTAPTPTEAAASVPIASPPIRHSRPGASKVIYLDFNGHTITGTSWNNQRGSPGDDNYRPAVASYVAKPFDTDGDTSMFSDDEQQDIVSIWERIAEDYRPFDVDVTTDEPASFTSTTGRILFTNSVDANGTNMPSSAAAGVAYLDAFGDANYVSTYSPAFVYTNHNANYPPYIADTASHEMGHNLSLSHDGTTDGVEYYPGHGFGATSWAALMGTANDHNVTHWSKGDYYHANNTQDDLAIIAGHVGYISDDHADNNGSATALTVTNQTTVSGGGVIGTTGDGDRFSVESGPGSVTFSVTTYRSIMDSVGGNLDVALQLLDANGTVVAEANPEDATSASLSTTVSGGTYYLRVLPAASGTPLTNPPSGYTNYGSLGQYTITGTIISTVPSAPSVTSQPASQSVLAGQMVQFSVAATGNPLPSYQWQRQVGGVGAWSNLADGGSYSGTGTATLTISAATVAMSGDAFRCVATNASGSILSAIAFLSVSPVVAPVITLSSSSVTISYGDFLLLLPTVAGTEPITYQWKRNGVTLPFGENRIFAIPYVTSADSGEYTLTATNVVGSITSPAIVVTVLPAIAPSFSQQPVSVAVPAGATAVLSGYATGTSPITYQWYGKGRLLPGATSPTLLISNAQAADAGDYILVATNPGGSIFSNTASVSVPVAQLVTAVSVGALHSLFLTGDGSVWAMGDNSYGQLGTGSNNPESVPVKIATGVRAIAAGNGNSFLLKYDGTLWSVGRNEYGQLGDGTRNNRQIPVQIASDVLAISAGYFHSAFIKSDSTLWTFGSDGVGQLGDGMGTGLFGRTTPRQIANEVTAVSAGGSHTMMIKKDGRLFACGYNAYGQFGNGTVVYASTPVQVGMGYSTVSAGGNHTMFLKSDGSLWAAGLNENGQLGDGTTINRQYPVQVASGVIRVATGFSYSIFVKADGSYWGSGDNRYLNLGVPSGPATRMPVQIDANVVEVSAGWGDHSLAIKTSGSLWAIGNNSNGQLGDGGISTYRSPPFQVFTASQSAPVIFSQPSGRTANIGEGVLLSSFSLGSPAPLFQWRKNGVDIPGANSSSYFIPIAAPVDSGDYTLVVSNPLGIAITNSARIEIIPTGFDVAGYYARNSDVAAAFGSNHYGAWQHFWNYGLAEGRQYDSQFIVEEYLLLNTDLTNAFGGDKQAALMHWLTYGKPIEDRIGRVPIGFNVDNYLARYPDLAAAFGTITPTALRNVTVWNHYVSYGVREGRSDGDFEAYGYLAGNSDLAAVFGSDVEAAAWHWYFYGRREGRRIPSNFDVNGYRTRNPDVVVVWGNDKYGCWLHYRDVGVYEGRTFDDLFRVLEYRARYSDVQTAYGNNLTGVLNHWLFYGKPEGRLGRNP